jgi:hypothetical protein
VSTTAPAVNVENIPASIRAERRWVVWRYEIPRGKTKETKVPYRTDGKGKANSTDPTTWGTLDMALTVLKVGDYSGIGFMLGEGYAGADFDKCLNDCGSFTWGSDDVGLLDTYAEVSPSGTGVKLLLRGRKPDGFNACSKTGLGPERLGKIEIYDHDRFFTVTGDVLDGKPDDLRECNGTFDALCRKYLSENPADAAGAETIDAGELQFRKCLAACLTMNMVDSSDGSKRLYATTCRCVEHGLSDEQATRCVRMYAQVQPFPTDWTDADIVKRLRDAERRTERGTEVFETFAPVSLGSLWESDPELRPAVIDGLVRRGQVANVVSVSKSYKTYMILALAIAMVMRKFWLDVFPTCGGRVLLIDLELQKPDITRRTHEIAREMFAPPDDLAAGIDVLSLRGRNANIDNIERMLLAMDPGAYALVIIDPLYKTYPTTQGGCAFDENSNAQMTLLYRRFERIAEHLNVALLLVHHATKGSQADKRTVDVGAGAGAQARSPDCHIALREHETDNCVVFDAKVRSFKPIDPLVLRWEYPLWRRDLSLDPTELRTGRRSRNTDKPEPQAEPKPEAMTAKQFAETFLSDEPADKQLVTAKARTAGLTGRGVADLIRLAVDARLAFIWTFSKSNKVYLATREQPVTESRRSQ